MLPHLLLQHCAHLMRSCAGGVEWKSIRCYSSRSVVSVSASVSLLKATDRDDAILL
jgi:hypothetical protein